MAQASAKALQTSLSKLQISQTNQSAPKIKKPAPADSWEDEADQDSDTETELTPIQPLDSNKSPAPPPPTPSSPSVDAPYMSLKSPYRTFPPFGLEASGDSDPSGGANPPSRPGSDFRSGDEKRPEKSTAVASRLIAAGIGQKAPRRTKEEREYDQAMKVQEKKRRDQAKEEEERRKKQMEKAKQDVWND